MSACVLDTDVVIAALDRSDAHHQESTRLLKQMIASKDDRLLSTVNYAEALVRPAADRRRLRTAVKAIDALGITLVAPTPAIARDAAGLRGAGISLADGFALATARSRGATVASFDRRVHRAVAKVDMELATGIR